MTPALDERQPSPVVDGVTEEASVVQLDEELRAGPSLDGALRVLRRGLHESPALRAGLLYTIALATVSAVGRLLVPVLVQQILDRGLQTGRGFNALAIEGACTATAAAIALVYLAGRAAYRRLVRASESALYDLRVRVFEHIHELSIADQSAERRGTFVARVTADVDTLAQFMEWGGISWITSGALMGATVMAMLVYSWQLTVVALAVVLPLTAVMRALQRGLLGAFDRVRTRVSEMLSEVSESVMGAAVIRAYGLEERTDLRIKRAIRREYDAQMRGHRFTATIFPMADLFGAGAVAAVIVVGVHWGRQWGLTTGGMVAFLFLVALFLQPLTELSETFEQTQTAIAGWRKVLAVLDLPMEVMEPRPGRLLPAGALPVHIEHVFHAYRGYARVLHDVEVRIEPGAHVAIVGATGSGKTTLAKLLCRLADPTSGRILVGGVDLREVAAESRRRAVRMVPQDGLLFDTSIRENVRHGRSGAGDAEVAAAFAELGLDSWLASLPDGLDTACGERGESLSAGERQLVALARAHIGGSGLLILDEATSAVDPETERIISSALERVSEGRTTVVIAHRLSTAEAADMVLVVDGGRIVERGPHAALVARGGVYASLYESWLGNTRAA